MRRWIAAKLCPEFETIERRFWYLWHQVDDVNKWCDGEARDATQWLLDQDRDYSRTIDAAPGARATPWGIQQFREWIYKKRARLSPDFSNAEASQSVDVNPRSPDSRKGCKMTRNEEFLDWIKEEIENAGEEFKSSNKVDPNCFGAGYDSGYLDALIVVRTFVKAQEGAEI